MSSQTDANRWSAAEGQFARQLQIADVPGFFSKKLSVEPGTRALLVEEGQYLGEVPPGVYTLESLTERLRPWRCKQTTVVLARQEEVPLEVSCENIPTSESLLVAVDVRLTVQMDDVALFLRNLLGPREAFSRQELHDALQPLVSQAVWEAVGRSSIADLTGPDVRAALDAGVEQALSLSMRRYGLRFGQVHTVSIRSQQYDEHRKKLSETWLFKEDIENRKALDELQAEDQLRKIKLQERTNELEILAQQVAADRMEGELAVRIRRVGLRNRLREAILSDRFNKIKSDEELARMIQEEDKSRLLRTHEMEEFVAVYRDQKEDRELARQHLVRKIDLERSIELEHIRADLGFAVKRKTLEHEIALAQRAEVEENRRWVESLQRQQREAEVRRQEQEKDLEKQRQWASLAAVQRREEEWLDLLQQQRLERVRCEVEVAQLDRRRRTDQIQAEIDRARHKEELEWKRRQAEVDQEIACRVFPSQVERLAAVHRLNEQRARFEMELAERRERLDAEINELREDKAAQRELARIEAMKNLGLEGLLAAAEQQRLMEKLSDAERAKADAIARALRKAMGVRQS